jgi:hypothetical protein
MTIHKYVDRGNTEKHMFLNWQHYLETTLTTPNS